MKIFEYMRLGVLYKEDPFYVKYLKSKRVLDIGCGRGEFLKKDPQHFTGIDLNPTLVSQCREKGFTAEKMNAMELAFPDDGFEVVRATQVVEHLSPKEASHFLSEVERVLVPGGLVYLTTPGVRNIWNTFSHIRPYPPTAFVKLLNSATEHYVQSDRLTLKFEGAWGTRFYTKHRMLMFALSLLDLSIPPRNPIGWTILLRKPNRN